LIERCVVVGWPQPRSRLFTGPARDCLSQLAKCGVLKRRGGAEKLKPNMDSVKELPERAHLVRSVVGFIEVDERPRPETSLKVVEHGDGRRAQVRVDVRTAPYGMGIGLASVAGRRRRTRPDRHRYVAANRWWRSPPPVGL
jgi:hypothetical protein